MFHDVGERSTRLDERTSRRFEELAIEAMPSPLLGDLARGPSDNVLVACAAALSVIGRPKTFLYGFSFLKNEPAIVVRAKRLDIVLIDFLKRRPLFKEAVG
jgi:hypothetical protein